MRPLSRTPPLPFGKQIRSGFGSLLAFLPILVGLTFAGCNEAGPTEQTGFGLETVSLQIGKARVSAELANTPEVSARGLMFRESLAPDAGMLFLFDPPRTASFYMKNTRIPLSIAFILDDGTIDEIRDMQPLDETSVASKSDRIRYALEVNQGWFARHGIAPGTRVKGLPEPWGN